MPPIFAKFRNIHIAFYREREISVQKKMLHCVYTESDIKITLERDDIKVKVDTILCTRGK